jgi:putative selenate reductase molybdopterin-binding subunit
MLVLGPGHRARRQASHKTPYDTGTFASTGTSVATLGVLRAAEALRDNLLDPASELSGSPVEECRLGDGKVCRGARSLSLEQLYLDAPLKDKLHVARKV